MEQYSNTGSVEQEMMGTVQSVPEAVEERTESETVVVDERGQSVPAFVVETAKSEIAFEDERAQSMPAATVVETVKAEIAVVDERDQSGSGSVEETAKSEIAVVDERAHSGSGSVEEASESESVVVGERAQSGSAADAGERAQSGGADDPGERTDSEIASQGEKEEEEEEECGFCLFMKAGPCGERFTLWQDCVDGAEKSEKDIVQQCAQMTTLLKVCMEMNPEYYGPVLDAERAMEAEVSSQEENTGDEGRSAAASATAGGGGEGVPAAQEGTVVQAVEVVDVVVDEEGQVVEVDDSVEVKVTSL